MLLNNNTNGNYTMRQLKLPLEIEKLIDISDPVYTFCEVMDYIDLSRYFVEKGYKTGRPRCDAQKRLKVILFAKDHVDLQHTLTGQKLKQMPIDIPGYGKNRV